MRIFTMKFLLASVGLEVLNGLGMIKEFDPTKSVMYPEVRARLHTTLRDQEIDRQWNVNCLNKLKFRRSAWDYQTWIKQFSTCVGCNRNDFTVQISFPKKYPQAHPKLKFLPRVYTQPQCCVDAHDGDVNFLACLPEELTYDETVISISDKDCMAGVVVEEWFGRADTHRDPAFKRSKTWIDEWGVSYLKPANEMHNPDAVALAVALGVRWTRPEKDIIVKDRDNNLQAEILRLMGFDRVKRKLFELLKVDNYHSMSVFDLLDCLENVVNDCDEKGGAYLHDHAGY